MKKKTTKQTVKRNYYIEFSFHMIIEDATSEADAIKKAEGIAILEGYKWDDVDAWETEQ